MPEEYPLSTPTSDERTLGILSHILAIVFAFGWIPPLIIWLIKKGQSEFIEQNALESLNFQITMAIAYFISGILMTVAIGLFLLWALGIVNAILVIIAAIKTSENKIYRYPFNLRLIK